MWPMKVRIQGRQAFGQTLVPLWSESQRQSRSAMESPCPDGIPFYWEESVPKNNHARLMKTSMVVCVCVGIATLDCLPLPSHANRGFSSRTENAAA